MGSGQLRILLLLLLLIFIGLQLQLQASVSWKILLTFDNNEIGLQLQLQASVSWKLLLTFDNNEIGLQLQLQASVSLSAYPAKPRVRSGGGRRSGFSVLRIWPIFGSVFRFSHLKTRGRSRGGCRGCAPPPPCPRDEAFFFVFAFKIFLPHRSVTSFLRGAPPPKKNPELRFWCLARFAGFLYFSPWFSVFVNNDGGFSDFSIQCTFPALPRRKFHPIVSLKL